MPSILSPGRLSVFVFFSGACALLYQVVWQREFRLIFGASTAASGAVLAAFIGGLGAGSLLLAPRVERSTTPFRLYARYEATIAIFTALSPFLFDLVRWAYVAAGGTNVLGSFWGTTLRVVLASLVVFVPTFFMGGTLPALARCATDDGDAGRGGVAVLYGVNTLGAVVGSALGTFFLISTLGNRTTLWVGCLVNLLVAVVANARSRKLGELFPPAETNAAAGTGAAVELPRALVLAAAFVAGAAFFLMELVWFRMLAPLLGGSVFTFGLVLCVVLAGIGLGGAAYGRFGRRGAATLFAFALTCLLETLAIAAPFALGDRIALFALLLRPLAAQGFAGSIAVWTLVSLVVVFPAAFAAGFQFPLLIALVGRARKRVAEQVGQVYASNTLGSVLGSLAGGFGFLPWLTATGAWKLAASSLLVLGLIALGHAFRSRPVRQRLMALLIAVAAGGCLLAQGPTAVWRHTPIGAGRVSTKVLETPAAIEGWIRSQRRTITWQRDGVEAPVALLNNDGLSFMVNGKSDGCAVSDAATQVMSGLLGAMLHPAPKKALVIGLGTGSTAGWLAQVPGIERVDVMEIEPVIVEVARQMTTVNRDVLNNPRVHLLIGDARELLAVSREKYDIVFSEPSNPYRIGIANLYTREAYQAVVEHLEEGGLFIQFLQAYEVDGEAVRIAYATLGSVFGFVETWRGGPSDLLLVGSMAPVAHSVETVRARVRTEPYATALSVAWFTDSAEGVFSHYLASSDFTRWLVEQTRPEPNTDDDNRLEFGLARSVGAPVSQADDLIRLANRFSPVDRNPRGLDASLLRFEQWLATANRREGPQLILPAGASGTDAALARAMIAVSAGDVAEAARVWPANAPVRTQWERLVRLAAYAFRQPPEFQEEAEALRAIYPLDVELLEALAALKRRDEAGAINHFERAFVLYRTNPWVQTMMMTQALPLVATSNRSRQWYQRLAVALSQPFAAGSLNETRMDTYSRLLGMLGDEEACARFYEQLGANVFWNREHLGRALVCFTAARPQLVRGAQEDLDRYEAQQFSLVSRGVALPGDAPNVSMTQPEALDAGSMVEMDVAPRDSGT